MSSEIWIEVNQKEQFRICLLQRTLYGLFSTLYCVIFLKRKFPDLLWKGLISFFFHTNFFYLKIWTFSMILWLQGFRKDNRTMLSRKELFKNTLRKAAHAWKRIIELRLTGARNCIYFMLIPQIYSVFFAWKFFFFLQRKRRLNWGFMWMNLLLRISTG